MERELDEHQKVQASTGSPTFQLCDLEQVKAFEPGITSKVGMKTYRCSRTVPRIKKNVSKVPVKQNAMQIFIIVKMALNCQFLILTSQVKAFGNCSLPYSHWLDLEKALWCFGILKAV